MKDLKMTSEDIEIIKTKELLYKTDLESGVMAMPRADYVQLRDAYFQKIQRPMGIAPGDVVYIALKSSKVPYVAKVTEIKLSLFDIIIYTPECCFSHLHLGVNVFLDLKECEEAIRKRVLHGKR